MVEFTVFYPNQPTPSYCVRHASTRLVLMWAFHNTYFSLCESTYLPTVNGSMPSLVATEPIVKHLLQSSVYHSSEVQVILSQDPSPYFAERDHLLFKPCSCWAWISTESHIQCVKSSLSEHFKDYTMLLTPRTMTVYFQSTPRSC